MLDQRLFVNARFHTLWAPEPQVQAVLTRGERIVALGTRKELSAHFTGTTEIIDLEGATVIPGLTDAHIHTANFAREIAALDLRGTASIEEALERVRVYSNGVPDGSWVFGGRWDFNAWTVPMQPHRHDLDAVTGGRPAALPSIDGHTVWANSAALAAVGIDATTPNPVGGEIVRDADGEPTGILREAAGDRLVDIMHSAEAGDLDTQLLEAQRRLLAVGLTGVHDFDGEDALQSYRRMRVSGQLDIRVHKAIPMAALDQAISEGRATGDGDVWLRTGPVKLFSDGALGSHSCHMNAPFPGGDGNTGIEVIPFEDLCELIRRAAGAGIAVATHAIGDRANELVLDAYGDLARSTQDPQPGLGRPASRLRHRIEHAQHLRPKDIARMAQLGVIPSMQPTHCTTDIPLASTLLASQDLASYAWRSLLDAGAVPAFGSDAPVEHPDPMYGIHAAVTRQNSNHEPDGGWQPGECVTLTEAIEAFTTGAAYASGEEAHKGLLRPGMLADFTALAADPFTVATSELRDIPVQSTTVGGVVRYRSNP